MVGVLGAQLLCHRLAAAPAGADQQLRPRRRHRAGAREPHRRLRRARRRLRTRGVVGFFPARRQRPTVIRCLVTDRRRVCPDAASLAETTRYMAAYSRAAGAAGVDLLLVRERDLAAADLAALVTALLRVTRGTATRLIVNDRLDVALACGSDGVHLRGDSMPVAAARRLAPPPLLVGRSVHSVDDAVRAAGADYLIAGTVFPTPSKPGVERHLGLEGLSAITRATAAPVLAIGGITTERIPGVLAAGAAGFAAIGLFVE